VEGGRQGAADDGEPSMVSWIIPPGTFDPPALRHLSYGAHGLYAPTTLGREIGLPMRVANLTLER
jgi:hypothetical protein